MTTRKRINYSEKQAALIWQQAAGSKLTSSEATAVNVIYPGRNNGDNGPDFRDAVIVNESHLVKGDVEIHIKSSDWYDHGHNTDAEYNNVVLHVVMWHDCNSPTVLQSGKAVPVICLAMSLRQQAYLLPHHLPCFQILDHMNGQTLGNILFAAGESRFKQKAVHFKTELKKEEAGQVLYRGMNKALGYTKNTKPFEHLAEAVPLNCLESREGVAPKQALLLGTAGLLPSQRWPGEFAGEKEIQELEQLWQSANKKVKIMNGTDWNLSHIYPNNSPVRRIAALAYLLERYSVKRLLTNVLQLVKGTLIPHGYNVLENSLTVNGDGYWRDHFDFNNRSRTKTSSILGKSKVGEIVVNVVLPFAFSWGELLDDAKITENAMELYLNYPKLRDNCLTRHMKEQLGFGESSDLFACHQQGLIHIFRNYCREGRCTQCPLVS